jgi:hypothetical protein
MRALVALIPLAAAACVSTRPVLVPARFIPARQPELVWVTVQNGERLPLSRPTIVGDTLHGHHLGERIAVPLTGVRVMHARQSDRTRTALLVAGVGVLAGLVVWRASESGGPPSGCVFDARSGWYCPP